MFSTFLWSEVEVVSDNKERGCERGISPGEYRSVRSGPVIPVVQGFSVDKSPASRRRPPSTPAHRQQTSGESFGRRCFLVGADPVSMAGLRDLVVVAGSMSPRGCSDFSRRVLMSSSLSVLSTVPPRFTKVPVDQIGVSGGVVSFVCQAAGDPKPKVSWNKKGKKVNSQRIEVSPPAHKNTRQSSNNGQKNALNEISLKQYIGPVTHAPSPPPPPPREVETGTRIWLVLLTVPTEFGPFSAQPGNKVFFPSRVPVKGVFALLTRSFLRKFSTTASFL